jgi:hypothetical protein
MPVSHKVPVSLTTDAQAPYGRTDHQRVRLAIHQRAALARKQRAELLSATHRLTPLDVEFLASAAKNQGISQSEFMRRIVAIERMNWQRNGLWNPGQRE